MRALAVVAALGYLAAPAAGETLVDRLLASYDGVETLQCEIRKVTEAAGRKVRTLSRVYYARPNRIHVGNVTPLKRTIVADGKVLFDYIDGDPKGFSRPVDELEPAMRMELQKVPGSPMDHLWRLQGSPEMELEPSDAHAMRRGYRSEEMFVVLSLDERDRLARIDFYRAEDMKEQVASVLYSDFKEATDGVWIPCLHESRWLPGESTETKRFMDLKVNEPVPEDRFKPDLHFHNVEFVSSFEEIYAAEPE